MPRPRSAKIPWPRISLRAIRTTVARVSARIARTFHLFRRMPVAVRIVAGLAALVAVWAAANWIVQTWRKPTEMFFPVGQALVKSPDANETKSMGSLLASQYSRRLPMNHLVALERIAQISIGVGKALPMA